MMFYFVDYHSLTNIVCGVYLKYYGSVFVAKLCKCLYKLSVCLNVTHADVMCLIISKAV